MNKRFIKHQQRGISVPMVLSLIAFTMVMGLTFMGIVRYQTQRAGFEQATITSAYVAEIGFQQVRARLSALNGDWTQLPSTEVEKDCTIGNANRARCQHSPIDNSTFSNLHAVYENPLDTTSRIIGRYEYIIETGQKRVAAFGGKTATGSTVGYVPGSAVATEQIGYDVYGNTLCDETAAGGSCPSGFVGVKVKAWLTDSSGNEVPTSRPQSVYGVLSMDSRDPDDEGPSGFMLESDQAIQITTNTSFNPEKGSLISHGGFYGPIHTNENFKFVWESEDRHDGSASGQHVINKTAPNMFDEIFPGETAAYPDDLWKRPFWGILMADLGAQFATAPRIREESTNYNYITYGRTFKIKWNPAGINPPNTSTYTVFFRRPDTTLAGVNVVRGSTGHPDADTDIVVSPLAASTSLLKNSEAWPVAGIEYMGTNYPHPSSEYYVNSAHYMLWNAHLDTSREFGSSEKYRARFISHSPIGIHEKMSYSGTAPEYRYYHTHPMTSSWPYYQTSHGHANFLGADLAANSTGDYDTTTWTHSHTISNDLSQDPVVSSTSATAPNTFLTFDDPSYQPATESKHEHPLLRPESGIPNYKAQLEQLNKYLELTLGTTLPRNTDGSVDPAPLTSAPFNATNYNKGYIVGKFPSSLPSMSIPVVDFRAVYFGDHKKTYTSGLLAGSRIVADTDPYDKTVRIWVDDNPQSTTYLQVASTQFTPDFKSYLFRQIPPEKVLLVRDATVFIGNMKPKGSAASCVAMDAAGSHCLPFLPGFSSSPVGEATIVDGQLTILSFTTTPPADENNYSKGDIVVVGDVLYDNDFYYDESQKTEMRQLSTTPNSPYVRSNTVNGPITGINDSAVEWVTDTDGKRHRDAGGNLVGELNGLGLLATHDIKLSVTAMANGYTKTSFGIPSCSGGKTIDDAEDKLTIHGQLVAGNRIKVHAFLEGAVVQDLQDIDVVPLCNDEPAFESKRDVLTFFGTAYSREAPNFSSYFRVKREYFFDRSLKENPLVGAPYYPKTAGDYKSQTVYNNYPSLVPGTWVQGAN